MLTLMHGLIKHPASRMATVVLLALFAGLIFVGMIFGGRFG